MKRVVLDTNIFVSSVLRPDGNAARVLALARSRSLTVVTSAVLLAELAEVLSRPAFLRRLRNRLDVDGFIAGVTAGSQAVIPTARLAVARDPADNRVLEAALEGNADYIVSGDQDLLTLREFRGIPIVTPAQILLLLAADV